jgi:hypothetical protein
MYDSLLIYIIKYIQPIKIYTEIDDSFIFRSRKKKIPNGHLDYDHAQKHNRSKYVWGQNLTAVIFVLEYHNKKLIRLPFRIKLKSKSITKIEYGRYMMKASIAFLKRLNLLKKTIVSFDSWFANSSMILEFAPYVTIVAQVKSNYAFYNLPPKTAGKRKRGAPKKYGKRLAKPTIKDLKDKVTLYLYSQKMTIHYSEYIVKARFLKGLIVKAVYIQFPKAKKLRVLISTDINMSATDIIQAYEKRWNIEGFFYEYKHMLGLKDMIQHSLKTYYKWAYIRLMSYNIINFLKIFQEEQIKSFIALSNPWRATNKKNKIPISFKIAQSYFFSFFSSFDKTKILHETINNSKRFLQECKKPANNIGYKPIKFIDFLLKTG